MQKMHCPWRALDTRGEEFFSLLPSILFSKKLSKSNQIIDQPINIQSFNSLTLLVTITNCVVQRDVKNFL